MIVLLLAGGRMRVKILNALAESVPVVSTIIGREGVDVTAENDVLVGSVAETSSRPVLWI